jgi:type IV secretory pathway ATPase VirB11/archaellum biosynthesis ATPase
MLSLFQEPLPPLTKEEALAAAKRILISSLNKGIIPSWETFSQELPQEESIKTFYQQIIHWPFLETVLATDAVEFSFHSFENCHSLSLQGEKIPFHFSLSSEDWQLWLEVVSLTYKQNWNVQHPFCSFYGEIFAKSYRFSLIHGSTSPLGISKLVLRKISSTPRKLSDFKETISLKALIHEKKNLIIAGSTGSGKTSLLSSLISQIPLDEHLAILEDTFEISCLHPYQTRLLSGSSEATSLKTYLSYSLRLSPDRIILGEMRSHEVVPFLMAMNTGHRGLLGTIHASSAHDALYRIALLFVLYSGEAGLNFEKVMELICRNLEYVVFMENKKVKEIIKILGCDKGVAFFETTFRDEGMLP